MGLVGAAVTTALFMLLSRNTKKSWRLTEVRSFSLLAIAAYQRSFHCIAARATAFTHQLISPKLLTDEPKNVG